MILQKIEQLLQEVTTLNAKDAKEIEALRLKYLSKKGLISALMNDFRNVPAEQKREVGMKINQLKQTATERINQLKEQCQMTADEDTALDLTRTPYPIKLGSRHPLTIVRNEIIDIFSRMGFTLADGPEVEDDLHVFTKMNFAADHPARDMQDTFYINDNVLLRTHTSPGEIRALTTLKPPFRILIPGKVFRVDEVDASHSPVFMQMEALVVDRDINFGDLKGLIDTFVKAVFGDDVKSRLRPSYFPFTEPSGEVDISCTICGGKGCRVCKGTGWLEIMGCGITNPHEIENCGLDPHEWKAIALGVGIDRVANLKYGINDIRHLYEGDARFLRQF